jgi:hypothetical protein
LCDGEMDAHVVVFGAFWVIRAATNGGLRNKEKVKKIDKEWTKTRQTHSLKEIIEEVQECIDLIKCLICCVLKKIGFGLLPLVQKVKCS